MFKKNIRFSFISEFICWFLFYSNSPWRRIAADIKVKVKHARRLQAIVMRIYLLIFILFKHSPWRRIAADIKVKVKHARRLQGIVM